MRIAFVVPVGVWMLAATASAPASALPIPQAAANERAVSGDFQEVFVVGKDAGEEHELLFGLVDVAFAPDGELYVLEERNHRVLVYGPDGVYRRRLGRQGQGPGEFQLPLALAITSANELAVWDLPRRAYQVFARDGADSYRRQVSWDDWPRWPSRASLRPWPDGGVVYLPRGVQEDDYPPEDIDQGAIMRDPLIGAGATEELLAVRHPRSRSWTAGGRGGMNQGAVFGPNARWDVVSDGRLAVVEGVDYTVRLVDPESGRETRIERPIPPRAVTNADRERERQRVRRSYEERGAVSTMSGGGGARPITPNQVREIVAAIEFADVIPVIRTLRVDAGDRLWIQRYGETYDDDGPIDIIGVDGVYVGTLPPMAMPDAFGPDGLVAWMERGEEVEVERVVVRRVPESLR